MRSLPVWSTRPAPEIASPAPSSSGSRKREDLAEAMDFAIAAGALAVEGRGLDGIATREDIEGRMREADE
ncbi:hypothetical protein [Candidatus Amarobacter glycogenicus]|uniref:hypothetical protein n=1 Tax=Candidatus Amarobacter glycogenicus TaxID=3140699 RepID=UPI0031350221|nr:hypothetical protein [Dehalococcoidia bacterium]